MTSNARSTHPKVRREILESSTYEDAIRKAVHSTKETTQKNIDEFLGYNFWPQVRKKLKAQGYLGRHQHDNLVRKLVPGQEPELIVHLNRLHRQYSERRPSSRGLRSSEWILGKLIVGNLTGIELSSSRALSEQAEIVLDIADAKRKNERLFDEDVWLSCLFLAKELIQRGGRGNFELAAKAIIVSERAAYDFHQRIECFKIYNALNRQFTTISEARQAHLMLSQMRLLATKKSGSYLEFSQNSFWNERYAVRRLNKAAEIARSSDKHETSRSGVYAEPFRSTFDFLIARQAYLHNKDFDEYLALMQIALNTDSSEFETLEWYLIDLEDVAETAAKAAKWDRYLEALDMHARARNRSNEPLKRRNQAASEIGQKWGKLLPHSYRNAL